ncbi:MAG: circadian clock protein KaiC [Pseudomonadota bacterium]
MAEESITPSERGLPKTPTGIRGLDEITFGGLPQGRPTLLSGGAGSGKTLMAMEFLVRGAQEYEEPGVFVAFEESAADLVRNVSSLGWDVAGLVARKKLLIDYIYIERSEIEETGEYDLEGLFVRLGHAIDSIGARRVVLDTLEALFSGLPNEMILRAEIRRLFRWLKDRGITAIITAERGRDSAAFTRHGLEEYVSDAVILLDHRVHEQVSTRRLRVAKYRGSVHGTNEYPFLIGEDGVWVMPVTSLGLCYEVSRHRVSTGVLGLDEMLGGRGWYRGSSVLVSGTAGTGKSSLAVCFVDSACQRGERAVYYTFEESPAQIMRNMASIGLDLPRHVKAGLLRFEATRPSLTGIEQHLLSMQRVATEFKPAVVAIDPISSLAAGDGTLDVKSMLVRLIDFLKTHQITGMFTNLTSGGLALEATEVGISSLMDTWIVLGDVETDGERNRHIHVLKSRGMKHSNQMREFLLTDRGIELSPVYVGPRGVLSGSARAVQEAKERAEVAAREQEVARRGRALERRRLAIRTRMAALEAALAAEEDEMDRFLDEVRLRGELETKERRTMVERRETCFREELPSGPQKEG